MSGDISPNERASPQGAGSLEVKHFNEIKSLLYDIAGITLADHKRQMVENRISKRIKELSISDFSRYVSYIKQDKKKTELIHLVNALTTNVTNFYREGHHFDHLKAEMTKMLNDVAPRIRVWSGGCSIGAEPYSAAITMYDTMRELKRSADVRILATDIDTLALARARRGDYPERTVKGLTRAHLGTHFTEKSDNGEKVYTIKEYIRKLVAYNYLNFNDKNWPMSGPFDFIFCRNALIYFNREKQQEYIAKMTRLLKPGGFLYLGHSEHSVMEGQKFKVIGQTIYQKP